MASIPPSSRQNYILKGMVAWLISFWLLTAIAPYDRMDWFLENLLVVVYSAILVVSYRCFRFSNLSYGLFTIFITFHLVGAHYTYAETPLGYWLQDLFSLRRNHYDRIVHFSYGLLLAFPILELLIRVTSANRILLCFIAVNIILAFSAFFEILEAIIAELVNPELGMAYLGTQGDIWDAQKDMALALTGAVLAMTITYLIERFHRH